ncbi:YARHG domain-containing protein [Agathobacter sp.]
MEKRDSKMKKIFIPIIIVLAILTIAFMALTVMVRVTGGHSSRFVDAKDDTSAVEEAGTQTADTVTGYELDDYSSNGQAADSTDTTDGMTARMSDANSYILATSDSIALTDADLQDLTAKELTYARNEIYARHGYVFDSTELNEYFATKSWYTADSSFDGNNLSALEQQNAEFIRTYQADHNLGYDVK